MANHRAGIAQARRVVVKVGSSSLTNITDGLAPERISALVDGIAGRRAAGQQIVLVSSGAVAAGLAPLGFARRPRDLATQQACASVGQMLLVSYYATSFARYGIGVGQVLITPEDLIRRTHYRNVLRTFERLLELGVVPVVNENDTMTTNDIQFGDNDRLAALVAHLLRADALILLSDVEGLYDSHPKNPNARLIDTVRGSHELTEVDMSRSGSEIGAGGMASKIAAANIATSAGIHVVIAAASQAEKVLSGASVGTYFTPTGERLPTRSLWLRHATLVRGKLTLDSGAVKAVREKGASLLAAGVVAVQGEFSAGDPVELVDENGHPIARGLVAFDADELPDLLGRSTHEIAAELRREVVHRDDLVLI